MQGFNSQSDFFKYYLIILGFLILINDFFIK